MTIEEVLEMMMEAFDQTRWHNEEFARSSYRFECKRVLEDAERLGIRFS